LSDVGPLFWVSGCISIYNAVCDQGVFSGCHLTFGWMTSAWRRSLSVEWPILESLIFVFLWLDGDEDMPGSGKISIKIGTFQKV